MEMRPNNSMLSFLLFLTLKSLIVLSNSKSIIKTLPGYAGDLPFTLETGYVGVGEKEDAQLFYYFVESTRNPEEDPFIFYITGGPGASALITFLYELGPLNFDLDNERDITLILNPTTWTQMANIIFVDIPIGTGFSYAETKDGWISSDTILANQATEFIKKFLVDHPKFIKNPLYVAGISYIGIVIPKITLDLYEGNEHGGQPTLNIQGYILISPLTDKFQDFNSRLEYAYRMALISDDIYKSVITNCYDNYVDTDKTTSLCANSLHQYKKCTSRININNILEAFCDKNDPTSNCQSDFENVVDVWMNSEVVQQALNIRQGKTRRFELVNNTLHYYQGKNDTLCYSYDIFSSVPYHQKLSSKNCQSLIISGDQDMTFPFVGVEQWIASLDLDVESRWKPFYVDDQVGGFETKYVQNNYSLTYTTIKGAGHIVSSYKHKETIGIVERWFSSQSYSSNPYVR